MNRRAFVTMAVASSVAMASRLGRGEPATSVEPQAQNSGDEGNLKVRWQKLDNAIRGWWDGDLQRADEEAIRDDPKKTLLFLPFPYISGGGSVGSFPEMYGWDTSFINLALLIHGRADIVRGNILDQLSMIDRFGKVLNGNRTFYESRGQPPLLAWSVEKYLAAKKDDDELAIRAYPSLERAYTGYWNGPGHQTPIGLSTCRDSGSKKVSPELAAEAESGLDFTPIFDGDVRRCVPIHVNAALIRQAQVLGLLAERFGWREKASRWRKEADDRAQRMNEYCWDESKGYYFEYDYTRKIRLPYYSLNGYWPLWAGIASKLQAQHVVDHLHLFDRPYGLTFTDKIYASPHPEYKVLQWAYPESWPPEQIIVALALERYGFQDQAREVSRRYINNVVTTWEMTGQTWERYNGVTGGHNVPVERHSPRLLHGFTSASAVIVGRVAFG